MFTSRDILFGVLLPGLTAAGVCFITARWFGCALGLALAYMAGQFALSGWTGWPPHTTEQWLFYLCVPAVVADWLERNRGHFRWAIRLMLVILLLGLTLRPLIQFSWTGRESWVWLGILTLLWPGIWECGQRGGMHERPVVTNLAWTFVVGTTALACAMGGSQKLGQLAGILATALFACALLSICRPEARVERGGLAVVVILWSGLLMNGYFYASVPWWAALLISLGPLGLYLQAELLPRGGNRWREPALTLAAVSIPLLAAAVPMAVRFIRAMSAPGAESYY